MSRLIDADKLIEIIEENNQKLEEQIKDARTYIQKEVYEAQLFTAVDIVKLIKEQPTAYDVNKVVVKLEARAEMYLQKGLKEYFPDEARPYLYAVKKFDEAIDIVKAGGIDD